MNEEQVNTKVRAAILVGLGFIIGANVLPALFDYFSTMGV